MPTKLRKNKCRVCKRIFCCENCREKHEKIIHNTHSECELCFNEQAKLSDDPSPGLLEHLNTNHWPLLCLLCNKVFQSFDEYKLLSKCSHNQKQFQTVPGSPLSPIFDSNRENSPITPFQMSKKEQMNESIPMKLSHLTSTPMYKEQLIQITTPAANIRYIYKSSLKATSSASSNDSKRSERRVTFSETPTQFYSKNNQVQEITDENNDSFASAKSCFVKSSTIHMNEAQNTLWTTALEGIEVSAEGQTESVEIVERSRSIWSSVTTVVKSVFQNVTIRSHKELTLGSKRAYKEIEAASNECEYAPSYKRMKISDVKCRPPIRQYSLVEQRRMLKPLCFDKATQTDEDVFRI